MKQVGWLISRYLVSTIVPYFVFTWLLLSVILFVQQGSRYADIFFSINIPTNLIWQLTIALVPNVIAFTCPMAMLIGTIIGLAKMQGDSELVAIRASGVGNLQIALPIIVLGIIMSAFAFGVNLKGVPLAASLVRNVALQTAIKKLESPIEPGVFNTEVNGYTIYVKGGDLETRTWKNIFIYNEDKVNNSLRLITSRNGRIDITGQLSELVLENATVSTLPIDPGVGKYVSENINEVRFAIKTRRNEMIDRLNLSELRPEELGLQQLSDYADAKDGAERTEAQILWQRRIILSVTPLIFCLLGTVIVLRFSRGGRGFGIAMALVVLVGFYLLMFLGEQLARTGAISVRLSSLIPLAGSFGAISWLSLSKKLDFLWGLVEFIFQSVLRLRPRPERVQRRNLFTDLTTGLRDFDLIRNLVINFSLTLLFLTAIFLIFTALEQWKFAGTIDGGVYLLGKYLGYLIPFVYLQIAPSAAMIGTLATYVIKSRNNEIVTWTSSGQSVYRLLLPCFLLTILLGAGNWLIQEKVLPEANRRQDEMRILIRNRGVPVQQTGKYWVANEQRIYSFEFTSDNERRVQASTLIDGGTALNVKNYDGSGGKVPMAASDNEPAVIVGNLSHRAVSFIKPVASDNEYREDDFALTEGDEPPINAASDHDGLFGGNLSGSGKPALSDRKSVSFNFLPIKNRSLIGLRAGSPRLRIEDLVRQSRQNRLLERAVISAASAWKPAYADGTARYVHSVMPLGFAVPLLSFVSSGNVASDNDNPNGDCAKRCVKNLIVYEFADNGERLQAVYRAEKAEWSGGRILFKGLVEKNELRDGKIATRSFSGGEITETSNPFAELRAKPNHLNTRELKKQIETADSDLERRNLSVGLEKKYTGLFVPFVMALFTAPFALSLSRTGKAATVGYAILLWLLFTGTSAIFDQIGLNGLLSPTLAVWSPLLIFTFLGVYMLSKVRT